ncbi:MAG TPA: endonuclease domain-containing protein [Candidatus Sulfotelmatobacter sp.]|jgi:very-short-patch-repair endonuclease|nr:endonuclease domain-containing protein [Candidatus Sulfotelmatobacter sp.]
MPPESPKRLLPLARALRKQDTWAEKLLWQWLRDRRFSAYKFRRQHQFGSYILDFFCLEASLNIELDGSQHGLPGQRKKDEERDAWLEKAGVKVLRFWNARLRREKEVVREAIWRELQARTPHPLPDYCRPMGPVVDEDAGENLTSSFPSPLPSPSGRGRIIRSVSQNFAPGLSKLQNSKGGFA